MSTSFHPKTDRQTESANAIFKQYLRAYVNYEQDNRVDLLPIAEFEANSDWNNSSGIAPFLATKKYYPCLGLEPPILSKEYLLPIARKKIKIANGFIKKIEQLRKHLRKELR